MQIAPGGDSSQTVEASLPTPYAGDTTATIVRELPSKETSCSKAYELSNGMIRVAYYGEPIQYHDPQSGKFVPIDDTLVDASSSGKDYAVNRANAFQLQFPKKLSGDWVNLVQDGVKVALRPAMRAGVAGDAAVPSSGVGFASHSATMVAYAGAFDGASLSYQSRPDGMKELITLSEPTSNTVYSFDLDLVGLTPRLEADGSISLLRSGETTPSLVIPKPCMWDSSNPNDPAVSEDVHYELSGTAPIYELDVVADGSWLSDPARVYPVKIDPGVVGYSDHPADSYISNQNATTKATNYCNDPFVYSNKDAPGYGFYQYGIYAMGSSLVNDMSSWYSQSYFVYKATLSIYTSTVPYATQVEPYRTTGSLSIGSVTWNNQPASVSCGSPVGMYSGPQDYDITTAASYWQTNGTPIDTCNIEMHATEGGRIIYRSAENSDDTPPETTIDYAPQPQATLLKPWGGAYWSTPQASWAYSEATSNPQVDYQMQVATTPTASAVVATCDVSSSASSGPLPVPSGGWVLGKTYWANVRVASQPMPGGVDDWSSWSGWGSFVVCASPSAIQPSAETTASGWFTDVDTNGDGVNDTPDDTNTAGRGSAQLSWDPVSGAQSYNIYMLDGAAYEHIDSVAATDTSWSSAGLRLYPSDSMIASLPASYAGPGLLAESPQLATKDATVSVPNETGAGVVLSDGTYLYVRAWSTYAGPTKWRKVGSGFGGTTAGGFAGDVGPDFSSKPILSAFLLYNKLYNGYADSATSITGVNTSSGATSSLSFSAPFLARDTGSPITGATDNIMLADDAHQIYSIAYGQADQPGAGGYNGWTVRVYDTNGNFLGDHEVGSSSYYTDGAFSDGTYLYLIEWNGQSLVTKIRLSDWTIASQWQANWAASREISGCYDPTNNVYWMGALDLGDAYRYRSGLDLRDDPTPLYAKQAGCAVANIPAYFFKVTAVNDGGETTLSAEPTITVQLANRTIGVNDDPQHTTYDLGSIAGNAGSLRLDTGALTLSSTDLSIKSFGPDASLVRTYNSNLTTSTYFAPGWRFNFEQEVQPGSGSSLIYTDAKGDPHRFIAVAGMSNTWAAPRGLVATITAPASTGPYTLALKGGTTLSFDYSGMLAQETDRHGDSTNYTWGGSGNQLTITAANGHAIVVTFNSQAGTSSATYTEGGVTKEVDYQVGNASVKTALSATQTLEVDYGYDAASSRLSTVSVSGFSPGGVAATWDFSYSGGKISHMDYPQTTSPRPLSISYPTTTSASIQWLARVGDLATSDTSVMQTFAWDGTGAEVAVSNPTTGSSTATATTDYGPDLCVRDQVSAAGVVSDNVYDARGNLIQTVDGQGNTTTYAYDPSDDLVSSTDPRGALSCYTYAANGDLQTETHQLDATESAQTTYSYGDSHGRVSSVTQAISATQSAVTNYSNYGDFMAPQDVTAPAVALSTTQTADVSQHETFDGFGDVLTVTDANQVLAHTYTYDWAGRVLTDTDATGTVTHYRYDVLGNVIETSRTAGAQWSGWTSSTVDPTGLLLQQDSYVSSGGVPVVQRTVTETYDGAGNQLTTTASDAGVSKTAYDAAGDVTARWAVGVSTDGTDTAETIAYDADGRVTADASPGQSSGLQFPQPLAAQVSATTTYTPGADEVATYTPTDAAATTMTYDADGNLTTATVPTSSGATQTSSVYDLGGREVSSTDASGNVTLTVYDWLGRELSSSLQGVQGGRQSSATYNALGWVISSTDPNGVVTCYTYDPDGRVLSQDKKAPGAPDVVTSHTYDAVGNEILTQNPDGSLIQMTYDPFGELVRRVEYNASGTKVHDVGAAYDAEGRTTEASDTVEGMVTDITYPSTPDGIACLTTHIGDTTRTIQLTAAGQETTRSLTVAGQTVSWQVMDRTYAQQPLDWAYDGYYPAVYQARDTSGRITCQLMGGSDGGSTYGYDARTGLKNFQHLTCDNLPTIDTTYAYTPAGRLASTCTSSSSGVATTTYSYDTAGDITSAGAMSLAYTGDELTTSAVGTTTTIYTYDALGRRIAQSSPDASATYGWDAHADRLLSYSHRSHSTTDVVATFAYDASGQRTQSVVTTGGTGGITTTTTYTYEGTQLFKLVAATPSQTTTLTYLYDELGRADSVIAQVSQSGGGSATHCLQVSTTDHGDVVGLTPVTDGELSCLDYAYDPFGNPTASAIINNSVTWTSDLARIAAAQCLRYAGYTYDSFSGLYYCSQRYYDPVTMQFISRDALQSDGEESAYQYCAGNPVGFTDPTGWVIDASGTGTVTSLDTATQAYLNAKTPEAKHYWWGKVCSDSKKEDEENNTVSAAKALALEEARARAELDRRIKQAADAENAKLAHALALAEKEDDSIGAGLMGWNSSASENAASGDPGTIAVGVIGWPPAYMLLGAIGIGQMGLGAVLILGGAGVALTGLFDVLGIPAGAAAIVAGFSLATTGAGVLGAAVEAYKIQTE